MTGDPRRITVDEKGLKAFLEKKNCGSRTLDVIVCLIACYVPVMILTTVMQRRSGQSRSSSFSSSVVGRATHCYT